MKMDMLNFTIQRLCTHLQDHTVQYERKKFQELLDKLPSIRLPPGSHERVAGQTSSRSVCVLCAAVSASPAPSAPGAASSSTTVLSLRSAELRIQESALLGAWAKGVP